MLKNNIIDLLENSIRKNWFLAAFSNYRGETITYKQLAEKILYLHSLYRVLGIKPGDKISILGKNSINWASVYLATISYGAVAVPILPDFKPGDVHHIVNHSDSLLLFSADSLYENLDEKNMQDLIGVISLKDFTFQFCRKRQIDQLKDKIEESFESVIQKGIDADNFRLPDIGNDKLAAIVYTSGTTGFSKGVMLLHNSLSANIIFAREKMPLEAGDTIVSFLPIAHVFGCVFEFLFPTTMGCHITFLSKIPSPKIIMKAFQDIHPQLILSVPLVIEKIYRKQIKPMLNKGTIKLLLKIGFIRKRIYHKINNKLTTVFGGNFREIVVGGAAFNEEVEKFLRAIGFRYTVGYGMTECGPLVSYTGWDKYRSRSTGQIVENMEVKIDSSDPLTEVGEILVRGENVMSGYYKNEKDTRIALDPEGWLHTGDLGIIDKDKFIYIRGRSKSMILGASGKNIYPEEIEARINNLPYVQESLVIDRGGKLIALIYPNMEAADKEKIDDGQMQQIMERNRTELNRKTPPYMLITKFEIFPEEFEKTPKRSIKRFMYMG